MRVDVDQYKDPDGVIDLAMMRRDTADRSIARVEAVIAAALFAVAIVGGLWSALTESPAQGLQIALLAIGLAWAAGCSAVAGTRRRTAAGHRAGQLMALGALPCLLSMFIVTMP